MVLLNVAILTDFQYLKEIKTLNSSEQTRIGYDSFFAAKFSDRLLCVKHIDLITFKNRLFNIQQ